MKDIVDIFRKKKLIFKSLTQISLKELGSRKKIDIYLGVNKNDYYAIIIHIVKKSRILQKEVNVLMGFHDKLEEKIKSKIKKKYIIIDAPLCSKAKKLLEENGWKVFS